MIAEYWQAIRRFDRDVLLYIASMALLGFAVFGGIYPVLFNLYLLRLGYGPEFVGAVNSVGMLTFAACSLVSGAVGQRLGVRRTMVAGLTLSMLACAALPLVEYVPEGIRAGWLIGTALVRSSGFALNWVNAAPFLMEATRPEERTHAYAVQSAASTLSGFLGSLVAGVLPGWFAGLLGATLDDPAPYRYPLWIAAALLAPAVWAILSIREPEVSQQAAQGEGEGALPLGLVAALALSVFLLAAGVGAPRSFYNVYLDDGLQVATATIGTLSAVGQLVASGAALTVPALSARWGHARVYTVASLGIAVGMLPLALIPHWAAAGLGYLGVISLSAITLPVINVYQMELVEARWRTTMSGITSMANGLSWAAITFAGGYVIAAMGYRTLFLVGVGATVVGAAFFGICFWRRQRSNGGF
jgi:MFS family permease